MKKKTEKWHQVMCSLAFTLTEMNLLFAFAYILMLMLVCLLAVALLCFCYRCLGQIYVLTE